VALATLPDAVARSLRGPGTRAQRARAVAEVIQRLGRFDWVGIYDVTPTEITAIAWTGTQAPAFPTFPRTQGLNGAAVATAELVVANDVTRDPRYLTTFARTGAEMIVPVRDQAGKVCGTLDIESSRVGAFGAAEQEFAQQAAELIRPLWPTDLTA
jgi:L-methionine (R)-S-oxide reductase